MKYKKSIITKKNIILIISIILLILILFSLNIEIIYPCIGIENINATFIIYKEEVMSHLKTEGTASIVVVLHEGNYTRDEIENNVLSTLTEDEFQLTDKFEYVTGFAGEITCKGLRKLSKDKRVDYFSGERYGINSIDDLIVVE